MKGENKYNSRKPKIGICRLCKQEKKLTFEHIPPKAVFNNQPMLQYDGNKVLNESNLFKNNELRFTKMCRGSGKYCLCNDCNSFTGGIYNKTYEKVANTFGTIIIGNTNENRLGIQLESSDIAWGSFFRQAMVMFVDVCDICSNDDELRYYLLHPDCNIFDAKKYRLFIYATNYNKKKITKIIGDIRIDSLNLKAAEITAFPLGMLLLIDEDSDIDNKYSKKDFSYLGVDITSLSMCPYNDKFQRNMTIPIHYIDGANSVLEILNCIKETLFLKELVKMEESSYEKYFC